MTNAIALTRLVDAGCQASVQIDPRLVGSVAVALLSVTYRLTMGLLRVTNR